ncbi:MAG: M3 family oligoendopeptidase [Alphaproteobacteria bacterium]|nr:M3 family oligoendopeptidase [Alphaproteobacteria bacterium]
MTQAVRAPESLGSPPSWDLSDLYPGRESALFRDDLAAAAKAARDFRARYAGLVTALDGPALGAAIAAYEVIEEKLGRLTSYAGLSYAADLSDPALGRFFQDTQEAVNAITTDLLFFALELNRIDDDVLAARLGSAPALARYRPWLRDLRAFRPYQLDEARESLLHEKEVSGRTAWTRLFDETLAQLMVPVAGAELPLEAALHRLSDKDPESRRAAAAGLDAVFAANIRLLALITNTLAKDKAIEDKVRGYPSPAMARHLANRVEPEVVEALVAAVRAAYPRLSHRYYALKARWLGKERLEHWDRNAPLPETDDRLYGWDEARALVLDAYRRFSPELAETGERFFAHPWIDAPVRKGKSPGAFAHPTVPSVHPYLLLNYLGKTRDVMTLAHELGHGVHQVLAARQGPLMAETPLTLAETASVFGEQLTFRALLAEAPAPARRALLAAKVEDMLNTVVRQIAFYEFERLVHAERHAGELAVERLGALWLGVQQESLGPAFHFAPPYANYWCYIPHFVHTPFYVYAYAFGDCLVNSLYATYETAPEGFAAKYLALLAAGGTLRHRELLAPFGLDASDPGFWSRGLGLIERFIDDLATA